MIVLAFTRFNMEDDIILTQVKREVFVKERKNLNTKFEEKFQLKNLERAENLYNGLVKKRIDRKLKSDDLLL